MKNPAAVVIAKLPEPGQAKTRLSPPLTPDEAAAFARASLLDVLDLIGETRARPLVAFTPSSAASRFREIVGPGVGLVEATGAHFGEALEHAQRAAFAMGHDAVALLAADTPHADPGTYEGAFALLARYDAVLGPSNDGGYYLLATRKPTPALFPSMAWSGPTVAARTRELARAAGFELAEVAMCRDVDTFDDLLAVGEVLRARRPHARSLEMINRFALAVAS